MPRTISRDEQTKRKLLQAGGQVFAKKGFRRATVRDICLRAEVNVACIAYHFGGKAGLYESVLNEAHDEALRRFPTDMGLPPEAPVRDRLKAYIHSFLLRLLGQGRSAWHGRILNWELIEPTEVLGSHLRRSILPNARKLQAMVAEILCASADDCSVIFCAQSIVGQCRHYTLARPILELLFPGLSLDDAGIAQLAEHITEFSLAGIRRFKELQPDPDAPLPAPAPGEADKA